jgi:hypothetical protein
MANVADVVEHRQLLHKIEKAFPGFDDCLSLYQSVLKCVAKREYVSTISVLQRRAGVFVICTNISVIESVLFIYLLLFYFFVVVVVVVNIRLVSSKEIASSSYSFLVQITVFSVDEGALDIDKAILRALLKGDNYRFRLLRLFAFQIYI